MIAINPTRRRWRRSLLSEPLGRPGGVDGVLIFTRPEIAGQIVRDCAAVGSGGLDAPILRTGKRVEGGDGDRPSGWHHGHRRRLPDDVLEPVDVFHSCLRWFLG